MRKGQQLREPARMIQHRFSRLLTLPVMYLRARDIRVVVAHAKKNYLAIFQYFAMRVRLWKKGLLFFPLYYLRLLKLSETDKVSESNYAKLEKK